VDKFGALQSLILLSAPTIVISSCPPHLLPSFPNDAFPRNSPECSENNSRYVKLPVWPNISKAFTEPLLNLVCNFLLIKEALLVDLLHHPIGDVVHTDHQESIPVQGVPGRSGESRPGINSAGSSRLLMKALVVSSYFA